MKQKITEADKDNAKIKFTYHKDRYIYARCKELHCSWHLRYKYEVNSNIYRLRMLNKTHNHKTSFYPKLRCHLIQKFISELPKGIEKSAAKAIVLSSLKIS